VVSLTPEGVALRERAAAIPPAIGCALGLDDESRRNLIVVLRAVTQSAKRTSTEGETNA
jgi:hypothetical protein